MTEGILIPNSWSVLTDDRDYFGQLFEVFNNSPRRPRTAMGSLEHATLCRGQEAIEEETRRAWAILGVKVHAVAIKFTGKQIELTTHK